MRNLDEDYDRFLGRQQERGVYCWTTRRWYKVVYQEPLTPADRIVPKTGIEQMVSEKLPSEPIVRGNWIANKTEQHIATIKQMLSTGPRMGIELADALGISFARLSHIIREYGKQFGIEKVPGGRRGYRLVAA
jgi:biotin operon repressor